MAVAGKWAWRIVVLPLIAILGLQLGADGSGPQHVGLSHHCASEAKSGNLQMRLKDTVFVFRRKDPFCRWGATSWDAKALIDAGSLLIALIVV